MGTLASELASHAERLTPRPRIYADANVPAGLVAHMRTALQWDVLFVLEEDDLRRAPDLKHYHLAQQLRLAPSLRYEGKGRPTKKERREIEKLRGE